MSSCLPSTLSSWNGRSHSASRSHLLNCSSHSARFRAVGLRQITSTMHASAQPTAKKEAILASHRNVLEATTDRRTERVQCLPAHIGSTITPSKPCHDLSICHKLRVIHALKRPVAIPAISHRAAPCTQYTGEHHTMLWSSSTGRHPSTHNHAGSQVPQKL